MRSKILIGAIVIAVLGAGIAFGIIHNKSSGFDKNDGVGKLRTGYLVRKDGKSGIIGADGRWLIEPF